MIKDVKEVIKLIAKIDNDAGRADCYVQSRDLSELEDFIKQQEKEKQELKAEQAIKEGK